jgi:hypothetical protein
MPDLREALHPQLSAQPRTVRIRYLNAEQPPSEPKVIRVVTVTDLDS